MKQRQVVVHLYGGIGNQLFQYTFGEYIRHRYHQDVYYDISSFGVLETFRDLQIDAIVKDIPVYETGRFFFSRHVRFARRFFRAMFRLKPGNLYFDNEVDESVFDKGDWKLIYFDGYWQDKKYPQWVINNVSDFYAPIHAVPSVISKYFGMIEGKNAVSVHIRRGDYLLPQNAYLNVCTAEYYKKAIEVFADEKDVTYLVFSDDIEWVKNNLDFGNDAVFVNDEGDKPFWDIYLMSKCKHHIISNSTFSWWGSFLDKNENKRIIAPKKWRNDKDNPPLYDNQWELIAIEGH